MPQNDPKISIVTPSYNQAYFLEDTIRSVLTQRYSNLEYIIIDGGSTDESLEIIRRYEPQISFWCSEPDHGHYDAINKSFARSSGEIMAWLNSDDMYCPWTLKTVASIFSTFPQIEWISTLTPCIWDWHGFCKQLHHIAGFSREAFLDGRYIPWSTGMLGWIQQESTFWRRSLWKNAGGYVSTDYAQASDFELWGRFYQQAKLYGTFSILGGFRVQQHQRTQQWNVYKAEAESILKHLRSEIGWSPNTVRQFALQWNLHIFPIIRKKVTPLYAYRGTRLRREHADTPEGQWKLEEYAFYHERL